MTLEARMPATLPQLGLIASVPVGRALRDCIPPRDSPRVSDCFQGHEVVSIETFPCLSSRDDDKWSIRAESSVGTEVCTGVPLTHAPSPSPPITLLLKA
jgi:hypothetical protein